MHNDLTHTQTKAHQYALTIVALEEKLLGMMNTMKSLQGEKQCLSQDEDKHVTSSSGGKRMKLITDMYAYYCEYFYRSEQRVED